MDVNGTKFHLLYGLDDWESCILSGRNLTLRQLREDNERPPVEWAVDERDGQNSSGYLRLRCDPFVFHKPSNQPLSQSLRRGADRDRYGNWFWLESPTEIRYQAAGTTGSALMWRPDPLAAPPAAQPPMPGGTFLPVPVESRAAAAPTFTLQGLAVTSNNYLIVGVVGEGVLIFDLYQPGTPLILRFALQNPQDMAATAEGGVLILDRSTSVDPMYAFWSLDASLRLEGDFAPQGQSPAPAPIARYPIENLEVGDIPVSISAGPNSHPLILIQTVNGASRLYEYLDEYTADGKRIRRAYLLDDLIMAEDAQTSSRQTMPPRAYDIAYLECTAADVPWLNLPRPPTGEDAPRIPVLLLAEEHGNQVFAYQMNRDEAKPYQVLQTVNRTTLDLLTNYLPQRQWQGRALVVHRHRAYYDSNNRWVPLQTFDSQRMAVQGVITTPIDFASGYAVQPFDGEIFGCVWHRLFLDAVIPIGTSITIRARAADDPLMLPQMQWRDQPVPYLRTQGSELAYYTEPAFHPPDPATLSASTSTPRGERAGTWELLFQEIKGRYIQLEITLQGTGRATPRLYALRAWYPRFSYLENYLPAVYREDSISASFLDRWLANFEGIFTDLEDKIVEWRSMIDPRITPPDALDWLAGWLGLTLDPMWQEPQRRFFIRHAVEFYRLRGTPHGLDIALRLYLDAPETLNDSLFQRDSMGKGCVRVTEGFESFLVGLPVTDNPAELERRQEEQVNHAHRFRVLIPHHLSETKAEMVRRIINLEKPAHTVFTLERYHDELIVEEMVLGIDQTLGDGRFEYEPLYLGMTALPRGYLEFYHPYNVTDRIVIDRDVLDNDLKL